MTSTDEGETLSKLSPFAIHNGVNGIAGGEVTIKRQFSGDIYLTYSKTSQSDNLLKCVLFGSIAPVAVIVLITDVHGIVVKRNNVEIKTNTLIFTFNTPQISDSLKKLLSEYSR